MPALIVLSNQALVRLIAEYQEGWFEDVLPIVKIAADINLVRHPNTGRIFFAPIPTSLSTLPYVVKHGEILLIDGGMLGMPRMSLGCKWMWKKSSFPLHLAIIMGDVNKVRRILRCKPLFASPSAMNVAAYTRNWDMINYFHNERTEGCTTFAMDRAAKDGYLDLVQFLHANRKEGCTHRAIDSAAENGHLEVVKFLATHRTEGCSIRAFKSKYTNVVEYLDSIGFRKYLHYQL
ncbi:hypothetical protein THRCLA_20939 [Thraustotheca clavata]|uniref:Ankyrin repeat-containing domain n=1 Tax=Thraustotheca clavata TaxID=74557 RepID=A0A1W0A1S1_9STRA|nr:hypothetical protein THRCLA_20939 [Thraustotheca clavata]